MTAKYFESLTKRATDLATALDHHKAMVETATNSLRNSMWNRFGCGARYKQSRQENIDVIDPYWDNAARCYRSAFKVNLSLLNRPAPPIEVPFEYRLEGATLVAKVGEDTFSVLEEVGQQQLAAALANLFDEKIAKHYAHG